MSVRGKGMLKAAGQGIAASALLSFARQFAGGWAGPLLGEVSNWVTLASLVTLAVLVAWNLPGIMRAALERVSPKERNRAAMEAFRREVVSGLADAGMQDAVRRRTAEYERQWAPSLAARDGHLGSSAWLPGGVSMAEVEARWPKFIQLYTASSGAVSMGAPPALRYQGPPQVHTGPHQVLPHVTCGGCQRPLEPELGEDGSLTFRCGPCFREVAVTAQQALWRAGDRIRVTFAGGTAAFSEALPCPCCGASVTSVSMQDGVILGCRNCTQQ